MTLASVLFMTELITTLSPPPTPAIVTLLPVACRNALLIVSASNVVVSSPVNSTTNDGKLSIFRRSSPLMLPPTAACAVKVAGALSAPLWT